LGAGVLVGGAVRAGIGAAIGLMTAATVGALAKLRWSARTGPARARIAIVPWGVIVESPERSRVLRWPGVSRVAVDAVHGRDQGSSFTRYSVVTIEAGSERFVGHAPGTLPLERLTAHLGDYAREASHRIALDLDGASPGEGPSEPDAELVLSAARAYVSSSVASSRLALGADSYRRSQAPLPSPRAITELSKVLQSRADRDVDPRPFAAVLAAELGATELADDLVGLVQSPLPLLAAIAKVAATKLGVPRARVGTLDEVEAFLLRPDLEALAAWQTA
jgi:hypothetical protein